MLLSARDCDNSIFIPQKTGNNLIDEEKIFYGQHQNYVFSFSCKNIPVTSTSYRLNGSYPLSDTNCVRKKNYLRTINM